MWRILFSRPLPHHFFINLTWNTLSWKIKQEAEKLRKRELTISIPRLTKSHTGKGIIENKKIYFQSCPLISVKAVPLTLRRSWLFAHRRKYIETWTHAMHFKLDDLNARNPTWYTLYGAGGRIAPLPDKNFHLKKKVKKISNRISPWN